MSTEIKLTKDDRADSVDNTKYRGMIGSLLYLTASRPDIMFSVCLCARFQENPKTTDLEAVKRIFRYIRVDSFDLDVANRERTRMRLFQFSFRDLASNWLERLPARSISTWEDLTTRFLAQFFPPERTAKLQNDILMFQQHQEDLALYENESWNDPRDFAKPVMAISLPQDVPSTTDYRLIELEIQLQRLMEAHLAPKSSVQVKKNHFFMRDL
ncbi:MAK10-like protein [Tanacetum coccineum]